MLSQLLCSVVIIYAGLSFLNIYLHCVYMIQPMTWAMPRRQTSRGLWTGPNLRPMMFSSLQIHSETIQIKKWKKVASCFILLLVIWSDWAAMAGTNLIWVLDDSCCMCPVPFSGSVDRAPSDDSHQPIIITLHSWIYHSSPCRPAGHAVFQPPRHKSRDSAPAISVSSVKGQTKQARNEYV